MVFFFSRRAFVLRWFVCACVLRACCCGACVLWCVSVYDGVCVCVCVCVGVCAGVVYA